MESQKVKRKKKQQLHVQKWDTELRNQSMVQKEFFTVSLWSETLPLVMGDGYIQAKCANALRIILGVGAVPRNVKSQNEPGVSVQVHCNALFSLYVFFVF